MRISGKQRRKRGELEVRVECEGRSAPLLARSSRLPRFRLKYTRNAQKITPDLASKVVTLAVPLSTQVCEWVPLGKSVMLGVAL